MDEFEQPEVLQETAHEEQPAGARFEDASDKSPRPRAPRRPEHEFFASCIAGLESFLADELRGFGVHRVRPLRGGVAFFCDDVAAYRACLWSRLASRVVMVLGRANAGDAELLYAGVYNMAWEDVIARGASVAVRVHGSNDQMRNTRFTALKVKDALVDRLRSKRGERPDVDAQNPDVLIDVRIRENKATVSFDFSGEALNHRTYLTQSDTEDTALKTTLAAGMLACAGWAERAAAGAAFVDPVCGDGVLLVEAAQVACDMAPGLLREHWGFFGWSGFDADAWDALTAEADNRFEGALARLVGDAAKGKPGERPDLSIVRMVGASVSSPMISRAREHVRRAGLRQAVSVELGDVESARELAARALSVAGAHSFSYKDGAPASASCLVASDLSAFAGRAADARFAEGVFAAAAAAAPEGSAFVVSGGVDVSARFGAEPSSTFVFGRGRIEHEISLYTQLPRSRQTIEIPDAHGGAPHTVEVFEQNSAQFAARLRKVLKERRKWAKRQGISCYRVYDVDLPDYAVAIDFYEGAADARGNAYLHIAEYAPPASIDPERARHRFGDVLSIAPIVCEVRPDHVFSKTRERDIGGSQYKNAGRRAYVTHIQEGGYLFEVDLAGKLDTGIFLDNRVTRQIVADMVRNQVEQRNRGGVRFLNLFAYTGTASVYAAGAGADETTTVDLSQTYLDWARRNMDNNGFAGAQHRFERGDVMKWIVEARRSGRRFDAIYVDPPTFSNSKAMGRRTWDVQRDHVELLIGVSRLLSEEGEALFCCNLRSFKPRTDELAKYGVGIEDVSARTIPDDFARTPKIHKCYLVRRKRP